MKNKFTLFVLALMCFTVGLNAQSVMELKETKAGIEEKQAAAQATVDELQAEIDALNGQIDILGGWQKGLAANMGFQFGKQNNWIAAGNPNSSSAALNFGLNAFANSIREDDFWRNKGIVALGWQSLNLDTDGEGTGFKPVTDLLNINSLYGRNLSDKIALSAMGELNSSVGNFLDPGTLDIGAGVTYTPSPDFVIVIHPLNYHYAFSATDVSSTGALGAKIRADYNHIFPSGLGVSSTLSGFLPYGSNDPDPSLFEYTWLNSLTYTIAGGVGLNLSFGLRNSEFDSVDSQSFYSFGVNYALAK